MKHVNVKKWRFAVIALAVVLLVLPGVFFTAGCSDDDGTPSELLALWRLQEFLLTGGAVTTVTDPAAYTVEFLADGTASIRSDCNRCSGSYSVDGTRMSFGPMACTMAACGTDSLDGAFNSALATTSSYEIKDGQLFLGYAGGELHFSK